MVVIMSLNKMTFWKSVRGQITVLFSISILLMLVILMGLSYYIAAKSIKTLMFNQIQVLISDVNRQIEKFYEDRQKSALFLANNNIVLNSLKNNSLNTSENLLKTFYETKKIYENVFISNLDPNPLLLLDQRGGAGKIRWGGIGFDKNIEMARKGKTSFSPPGISPITNLPVVLMTSPIKDGNNVIGILGLPFDVYTFSEAMIKSVKLGDTGELIVLGLDGTVIAHPDKELILQDGKKYDFIKKGLELPTKTVIEYSWKQEGKRYAVFTKNEYLGIAIGFTISNDDIVKTSNNIALYILGIGLSVFIIVAIFLVSVLNKKLKLLSDCITIIQTIQSTGDLRLTLDTTNNKDEIGQLAKVFNNLILQLHDIIKSIESSSNSLIDSSQKLLNSSKSASSDSEEISRHSQVIASSSLQMNQNLSNIVGSIEEMSISIGEVSQKASESANIVKSANEAADQANNIIRILGENAQEIGKVIGSITDIAEKTNLLALNASIEAAGAGESGKGFAVVASEVKELARQSKTASEEIRDKIVRIQKSVEQTTDVIHHITDFIATIKENTMTIASAMEEHSIVAKESANNTSQTNIAANEVTKNIEQLSSVSKSRVEADQKSSDLAEDLQKLSENLFKIVHQFKLRD